ncbi:MAG TPA: hypothetical protein VG537_05225 [Candidatus Kapabacteria bacterium]|nr:hypothetical protein [Candidatus Kapabacteria bacterium]
MPRRSIYRITIERLFIRALLLLSPLAVMGICTHPVMARTPHFVTPASHITKIARFKKIEEENNRSIDELIQQRIQKEWDSFGSGVQPELVKT